MLFLLRVYHKVSSFLYPACLHMCALQYRLALSVSDANVNKDHITSGIVSDSNFLWVNISDITHIVIYKRHFKKCA